MNRNRNRNNERGVALFLSLAMIAILGVLVLEYMYATRVEVNIASGSRDRLCAYYAARSGMYYAMNVLREDDQGSDTLQDEWAQPMQMTVGEATTEITITDENRKLCINDLVATGDREDQVTKDRYIALIDNQYYTDVIGEDLVAAIIDWIDKNEEGDAESDFYEELEQPYYCPNRAMRTIYEMKYLLGMNDRVFYGTEALEQPPAGDSEWEQERMDIYEEELQDEELNPEYFVTDKRLNELVQKEDYEFIDADEYEYIVDEDEIQSPYGLIEFFTTYRDGTGPGKVNINTVHPEILRVLFDDDLELVNELMRERIREPFENTNRVKTLVGETNPEAARKVLPILSVNSTFFRVQSVGQYRQSKVQITAVFKRSSDKNAEGYQPLYWRVENIE